MLSRLLLLLMFGLMVMPVNADTEIGKTVFARGITMAESARGDVRVLAGDSVVYEGDTLTTGEKSFVVLEFDDGTRMSLRPNTIFQLEQFKQEQNLAEVRLFTGGLRASTGLISKKNPEGFKLYVKDTVTTLRDAEFDVRLCKEECEEEAARYQVQQQAKQLVVGRVAEVRGTLTIDSKHEGIRLAVKGAPLYEGDLLQTGIKAYAVLAFRDKGRVTIQADTTFKIDSLQFDANQPKEGNAAFNLLRGGLRALTGIIGVEDKEDYKVNTPVATIGIRGTGFDLMCVGNCVEPDTQKVTTSAVLSIGDGLFASVWQGTIVIETDVGKLVLEQGSVVLVPDNQSEPKVLPKRPPFLEDNQAPRPDLVFVDHNNLFAAFPIKRYRLGLFFALYRGHLTTVEGDNQKLDLGREEASSYDVDQSGELIRLDHVPPFLREDPYFNSLNEDFWKNYDFLDENFDDFFECTIQ